ncbi:uncharacterized protein LOC131996820 [Stomoxys calcitrans]|uniref:uncharacterized protein LOC131996820 n=1 Tax=Stomoxys calcitrans TaxID=35570 RepID=UPI0027E3AD05|nr:uncharacterized protein LOC131996820 [Stomoxys calcitrans]
MRFLIAICLILCMVAVSWAAEARGVFRNTAYPGKCYMSSSLILSKGEVAKNPNIPCGGIRCEEKGVAVLQTCPIASFAGYKQGDFVNTSKPYPACCKRQLIKLN